MTDGELSIELVAASELYELRRRVLRGNDPAKSVEDPRDRDDASVHLAGRLHGRVVVSASFFPSTAPDGTDDVSYQLRYMATDVHVQGRGYGAAVLAAGERRLRERDVARLWANARDTALGFYLATGWRAVPASEHLSPETGLPHTVIVKVL